MANEFLDALSPEAEKRIKAYGSEIDKLIEKIGKASSVQIGGRTPSGTDSAIKALQDDVKKTDDAIQKLQKSYVNLAQTRKAANVQERVDNSIILQQQKQQATLVSEVAGAYRKLSAAEAQSAKTVQDLISRGKLATQTQRQFNAEVNKAQKEFDGYRKRVLAADAAVGRWQRTGTRTIEGANQLAGALGLSLGIAGTVALAKNIFDITRELQSLDLALKQVMGNEVEATRTQQFLAETAEAYGVGIQQLTKSYIGFYAGSKNAIEQGKISAEDINQIFQSVAKAAGAMGLSVEQQEGAFLALQQMISKGNIQAEELRGQLSERLPGAFGILAKSMGVTEIELNKMLKDGKVLAAEVLPAFAKELEKAYGIENLNRVETLNASVSRLSNSWIDFVASLSEAGSNSVVTSFLDKLSEAVKGASIILESEATSRNKTLAAIREKGYEQELSDYKAAGDVSEAYIARKRIQLLQEIEILQSQIRVNTEANQELRRNAKSAADLIAVGSDLRTNQAAIKAANNQISMYYGKIAAGTKYLEANNKAVAKNTELTEKQKKAIDDANRERYQTKLAELELEQQVIDRTLNDEETYYTVRIGALEKHRQKRIEILSLMYVEEMRRAGGSLDKQKQALIKFHSENLKEIENYNKKLSELELLQLQPEEVKPMVDAQALLAEMTNRDTESINKNVEARERYKKALKEAEDAMKLYAEGFVESFFGDAGLDTLFDILSDKIIGFGVDATTTALAITEAFQEMYNFISKSSQQNFEKERATLQRKYEVSKLLAGDNADAIAELDREREERQREIANREAKANKELAIFNVAMNAAQGIVATFKDGFSIKAVAFAAILAGIAAVQIAAINSQDVPQYFKGTENHPGGLMIVNDAKGAKYREIIQTPDGKRHAPEGRNKIVSAPKGTKVFTAERSELMFDNGLNSILNERGISLSAPIVNNNIDMDGLRQDIRDLHNTIANKPTAIVGTDSDRLSGLIRLESANQINHNARIKVQPIKFTRG